MQQQASSQHLRSEVSVRLLSLPEIQFHILFYSFIFPLFSFERALAWELLRSSIYGLYLCCGSKNTHEAVDDTCVLSGAVLREVRYTHHCIILTTLIIMCCKTVMSKSQCAFVFPVFASLSVCMSVSLSLSRCLDLSLTVCLSASHSL